AEATNTTADGTSRCPISTARAHWRLHGLLHIAAPRHGRWQAVQARQPLAAQLQMGAHWLPRACLQHWSVWANFPTAGRPETARPGRRAARVWARRTP